MYWTVNYFSVAAGRTSDYMAWGKKYQDWLKSQKGFQTRTVLNSYSHPSMYAGSLRWESRDASRGAMTGAEFGKFLTANSVDGIMTFTRPAEAFEDVVTVGDPKQAGKCLLVFEFHIDLGKTATFEKNLKERFELRQKLGHGYRFSRLFRLMGNTSRYVGASTFASREDALASNAVPEWQEYLRAHPHTEFTGTRPVGEMYEVMPME